MFIIRKPLFLFLLLTLATSAFAQTATAPSKDPLEANLRKHVEYLASDKLEGRRTGQKGAKAAAEYVREQFAKAKLKPGFNKAYLQPFPYVAGVTLGKGNFLNLIPAEKMNVNRMEVEINYQPFANSPSGSVPSSPIVFAGYGIVTPDKTRDDYAGIDAKDKVVLVFDGAPDANNPHSAFAGFNVHTKANIAKERGARALIIVSRTQDLKLDRLSQLNYEPTTGETAVPVITISGDGAGLFSGSFAEIQKLEAELAAGKSPMPKIEGTAEFKIDLVKNQSEAYNVIGVLEGTDATLKNEAIVIGAHYDHLGHGGQGSLAPNTKDIHHGADDNASGTAAVIELANLFAKAKANKRTIIFMAFGGEEEGLLGSKYYVNHPTFPIDKTIAMINLDMVGRLNENKLTVGGIGTATEMKALVETTNNLNVTHSENDRQAREKIITALSKLKVNTVNVSVQNASAVISGWAPTDRYADVIRTVAESGAVSAFENQIARSDRQLLTFSGNSFNLQLNEDGFGPSDHSSFYGKQIPVLFLFTGTHVDYHKPSDTAEKVNYEGLTRINRYVSAIATSIDQNPTRPTYKVAQSSGQMVARTTFSVSLGTIPSYAEGNDGLTIDGVRDGGPAAKAGLKGGDKIIKLAGKDVRNISDYMFAMSTMKPDQEYEVVVKRGDETITMKIVPAAAARR